MACCSSVSLSRRGREFVEGLSASALAGVAPPVAVWGGWRDWESCLPEYGPTRLVFCTDVVDAVNGTSRGRLAQLVAEADAVDAMNGRRWHRRIADVIIDNRLLQNCSKKQGDN
eukprot:1160459-Pelagomonas_calceolata.AAC.13